MTEKEIAWSAGLFEGEGSIVVYRQQRVILKIDMTDRDVVERFYRVVGFGSFAVLSRISNIKTQWRWAGSGARAIALLEAWIPLLGNRRRERARAAISVWNEYCRNGRNRGRQHVVRTFEQKVSDLFS